MLGGLCASRGTVRFRAARRPSLESVGSRAEDGEGFSGVHRACFSAFQPFLLVTSMGIVRSAGNKLSRSAKKLYLGVQKV